MTLSEWKDGLSEGDFILLFPTGRMWMVDQIMPGGIHVSLSKNLGLVHRTFLYGDRLQKAFEANTQGAEV